MSSVLGQGTATADRPPPVDPGALPAGGNPAPPEKTEKKNECFGTQPGGDGPTVPQPQRDMNLPAAWQFTKGAGQIVAVIDTGVSRNPRLPGLIAGGDYVGTSDGTDDCDVHGTAVAGIIAAAQVPGEGFSGVAPEAQIIGFRQSSSLYQLEGRSKEQKEGDNADGYGNVGTMAAAVRRAVDMNATVINISEVACASNPLSDAALGAAVKYAYDRNVVVVAAAGNNDNERCKAGNPDVDPLHPTADPWTKVATYVSPAWYDDYVLTVGSVSNDGVPSSFTVAGPWVDVAAPGENYTSLDARGSGTAVGKTDDKGGIGAFTGTSFATPLVSGTVALIRAKYPQLTAQQVMDRVKATAHRPPGGWNPILGWGSVDPVAALTAELPTTAAAKEQTFRTEQLPVQAAPPPPDHRARNTALIGVGIIAVLLILGILASFPMRFTARRSD